MPTQVRDRPEMFTEANGLKRYTARHAKAFGIHRFALPNGTGSRRASQRLQGSDKTQKNPRKAPPARTRHARASATPAHRQTSRRFTQVYNGGSDKVIWCKYLSSNLSLHGCRANFPDGLRPPRFLFLDALLPLCVGGSDIFILPETTLVSSPTLSFCFPLTAFSLSSFSTTLTPAIRNHCACFNSLISGVKVSQSGFMIYASLHHRLQLLIIGLPYLLVKFHVVQFQYGF